MHFPSMSGRICVQLGSQMGPKIVKNPDFYQKATMLGAGPGLSRPGLRANLSGRGGVISNCSDDWRPEKLIIDLKKVYFGPEVPNMTPYWINTAPYWTNMAPYLQYGALGNANSIVRLPSEISDS